MIHEIIIIIFDKNLIFRYICGIINNNLII